MPGLRWDPANTKSIMSPDKNVVGPQVKLFALAVGVTVTCKPETKTCPRGVGRAPGNAEHIIPAPPGPDLQSLHILNRSRVSKHATPRNEVLPLQFGNTPLDAARHLEGFRTRFAPDEKHMALLADETSRDRTCKRNVEVLVPSAITTVMNRNQVNLLHTVLFKLQAVRIIWTRTV